MAISLVGQAGIAGGNGTSPAAITYTSTGGNTLILTGHLFDNNSGAFVAPTSVTDSTGGTNVWHVSTSSSQAPFTAQSPPTCSITDPSDGGSSHICEFVAWCVGAAAVTSVTLAWEGGVSTWRRVALTEWSGIVQFDNSWANGSTSGATSVTSGPVRLSVPGELVIGALDFGGGGTESFPAGWIGLTSGGGGNAYDLPGVTNGAYSPVWTNTTSSTWAGALAVFSPGPVGAVPLRQPVRARITLPPRGRITSGKGAPASSPAPPATGPAFYPLPHPARAVIVQNAPRGHVHARSGAPVNNPTTGPAFRQATQPARAPIPQVFSRGHHYRRTGAPLANPTSGPPVTALTGPVRAKRPLFLLGRTEVRPGAPLANPTAGPPVKPLPGPARTRIPGRTRTLAPRGGTGAPVANPTSGPQVRPLTAPVQARHPLPPRGHVHRNAGAPVQNPVPPLAPFSLPSQPVRTRITLPPRGHRHSNAGAPVNNPTTGPVIPVLMGPAGIRVIYVRTGHSQSLASPPAPIVAPLYPLPGPVRARQPLPPRGRVHKNSGAPVHNPTSGPPVTPLQRPAQARPPLPRPGRTTGNKGAPVNNPVINTGPPFYPFRQPARSRITPPPRGRIISGKGAPLSNPTSGPVFRQATQPARARIPQAFSKGRATGNPGTPPPSVAPFRAPAKALRAQPAIFLKGRATGSAGAPLVLPAPAPAPPLHQPARIRITLPPRGRTASSAGAPVSNPVIHPAQFAPPAKALHAQPAVFLKGRIVSSPGAPVRNATQGPPPFPLHQPVRARSPFPGPGRGFAGGKGTFSPFVPPPLHLPGVLTITPAGAQAAVVTITPAGAQTAVLTLAPAAAQAAALAAATPGTSRPATWPPQPAVTWPPPRPADGEPAPPLVYPPSG